MAMQPTMMLMYGVAVGHALQSKGTSVGDLEALRDQVAAIVAQQGDLSKALAELESEIGRRGGRKSGPPETPAAQAAGDNAPERFLIAVAGIPLDAGAKSRLEERLREAVLAELAQYDSKGDLVATPLSELKFGPGLGGATMGLMVTGSDLRI